MKLSLYRDDALVNSVPFTPDLTAEQMADHAEDFVMVKPGPFAVETGVAFEPFKVKHGDKLELESNEYAQEGLEVQTTPEQPVDAA